MRSIAGVLAVLCLLLTACPPSTFRYRPREKPLVVEVKGDYVHDDTGITFPWSVEGFIRAAVEEYDYDGHEVGVHYKCYREKPGETTGSPFAVVSVYVYPASQHAKQELDRIDKSINEYHHNVRCLQKGKETVALGGRDYETRTMQHEYRDPAFLGHQDMYSRTILVRLAGAGTPDWFLKYRITCRSDRKDEVHPAIEKFLAGIDVKQR